MYAPDPTFDDDYDEPDSPDGWERALLDRQLEELRELAAMGMDLARDIHRRAKAASDEAPLAERQQAALNFARVTRAVRLTHALETRLVADFKARSAGAGGADADEGPIEYRWIGQLSPAEKARRTRLQDVVRGVAEGERRDPETVERLVREAGERVEDDGIFGNLMTRPFGEILALICADLGLKPDWDSLSREVWAQEEIRRGAKGSPFAAWRTARPRPPPFAGAAAEGPDRALDGAAGGDSLPLRSP